MPCDLTEHERTLFLWKIKEDRGYDEIAGMLGITPVACRKQMSPAFEKCRRLMLKDLTEKIVDNVSQNGVLEK